MPSPSGPSLERDPGTLHGAAAMRLGVGVVLLELAAAVSTFVANTLLPQIERGLEAQSTLPLLVAGTTVGLFIALPMATRIIGLGSPRAVLAGGLILSIVGAAIASAAPDPWTFAIGRLLAGFAGGILAVYGVSAAIRHLTDAFRLKVMAAMSAMWLLPAMVGPTATLGLDHLLGWRLTLLTPVPLILVGRLLVVRAVPPTPAPAERPPTPPRAFLVPLGVAGFTVLSALGHSLLGGVGLALAMTGFTALMPTGTTRLRPGAPAALTVSQGAWSLVSLAAPRLSHLDRLPTIGLALTASSVAVVAAIGLLDGSWLLAVSAWTFSGVGVGLAYPQLYLRATTTGSRFTASQLATAAITTESFGGLVGASTGAALAASSGRVDMSRGDALAWAFVGFALVLVLAAFAASRSTDRTLETESAHA